ncbi:MAG: FG-GAP-like repeat-containing protein [Flavobacteriales bacterium]|jgi:hypothetical protein
MRSLLVVLLALITSVASSQFTKIEHGFSLEGNPAGHSPGVSWFDYDRDGWDDLTLGQGGFSILVYRNVQGTLMLVHAFENSAQIKAIQWVDYDNDGDSDFFACGTNMSCRLWRNDTPAAGNQMIFTEVTANLSLPSTDTDSMGSSWGDYDNDGFLDVYVCNYYAVNWLLHNNGDGTFTNVALDLNVGNLNRPTYMSTWIDYNNDCLLDLFIVNDAGMPTEMFENTGEGFETVGDSIGLAINMDGMGITWSDYDADGDLDLYLTNIASGNKLMRNDAGLFTDVAAAAGVTVNALSWGCMFMDFNHDGLDDLHVATQANLVAQNINFLFEQNPDHTFNNVSMANDIGNCFTSAKGDLNNDGYWDFADVFVLPFRFFLFQNNGGSNHWIKLSLTGVESNRDAVGTKIRYWVNGQEHVVQTFCGESFFGQDSQYEILSLGSALQADTLELQWPSGAIERYYNLQADRVHAFEEGASFATAISSSQQTICPNGGTVTLSTNLEGVYTWFDGSDGQSIVINAPGDYQLTITNRCGYAASLTRTVEASSNPEIGETVTPPSCFDAADGCIAVTANGEVPANIVWTGPSTVSSNCNLIPGDYHYTFTDEANCVFEGTVSVVAPQVLTAQAESVAICAGTTVAGNFTAAGGTGSYTFMLSNGSDPDTLQPGDYTVVVTDGNGCVAEANFTIGQLPVVNLVGSVDSVCVGQTAALSYFGSGGVLPYSYDWQGNNPQALSAGTYTFTITDGNDCSDELTVTVGEFPALEASIVAFTNASGGDNGSMEVAIQQGQGPFTIEWSTGDTTAVLDSIGQGRYSVEITDANGCAVTDSQSIVDTNIDELQMGVSLFPNPTETFVTLNLTHPMFIQVYDAQGKHMYSGSFSPGSNVLDCSPWPIGLYTVNATDSTHRVSLSLLKF